MVITKLWKAREPISARSERAKNVKIRALAMLSKTLRGGHGAVFNLVARKLVAGDNIILDGNFASVFSARRHPLSSR